MTATYPTIDGDLLEITTDRVSIATPFDGATVAFDDLIDVLWSEETDGFTAHFECLGTLTAISSGTATVVIVNGIAVDLDGIEVYEALVDALTVAV
jgi:hypothetical protein